MATTATTATTKKTKVKGRVPGNGRPALPSRSARRQLKPPGFLQMESSRRYWLFVADPAKYHWDTLFVKGKELWGGIRNAKAQRYMKQIHRGDFAVCYHSAPERSIYALAVVACDSYLDPTLPDTKNRAIDLKAVQRVPRVVPLKELKKERLLRRMKFLTQVRVPVAPLTEAEYNEILRVAGVMPISPF